MRVRDELGELFADVEFAQAFGVRGRQGWSPGQLALVTVLQFAENLTDRAAAHRVRFGMDFKYALGLDLDDPGFDASVLSEFRARLVAHNLEERALDLLLAALKSKGLVKADGQQRTDSTRMLAARDLLPAEHYLDSGYPSAELIVGMKEGFGVTLVTPVLLDSSPQARSGAGFGRTAFAIDWDNRQATCPRGHTSTWWSPTVQRGTKAIVVKFDKETCQPCPVRDKCTRAKNGGRTLSLRAREQQRVLDEARAQQTSQEWRAKYATRAGVEGTIHQAMAVTGMKRARYRGLKKTHLEHSFSAVALNLIRLDAWWNGHPLDRTRTSHLARLDQQDFNLTG
ncbi:transposase [Streptomyces sp. NBC_00073]|uniref:transposase n=1 Tax=Streptomyces sp. NBC_00073 TaxID=2975640 RepID=UPI0038659CFD